MLTRLQNISLEFEDGKICLPAEIMQINNCLHGIIRSQLHTTSLPVCYTRTVDDIIIVTYIRHNVKRRLMICIKF